MAHGPRCRQDALFWYRIFWGNGRGDVSSADSNNRDRRYRAYDRGAENDGPMQMKGTDNDRCQNQGMNGDRQGGSSPDLPRNTLLVLEKAVHHSFTSSVELSS